MAHSGVARLCLLLAILPAAVYSWGPSSHYYFTCTALSTLDTCMTSTKNLNLQSGTAMPDAFFFGGFITGSSCQGLAHLHDLMLAGYMVKAGMAEANDPANLSGTFNGTEFGIGYGAHCVGDVAGFFPGAYLGSGFIKIAGFTNWVSVWPFMNAVDADVISHQFPASFTFPKDISLGETGSNFFVKANQAYQAAGGKTPSVTAAQVQECTSTWNNVITAESLKAYYLPESSYEYEMVYNDNYGAQSYAQAEAHFQMAASCAIDAIRVWKNAIVEPSSTPIDAYQAILSYYTQAFKAGKCTPGSSKTTWEDWKAAVGNFQA